MRCLLNLRGRERGQVPPPIRTRGVVVSIVSMVSRPQGSDTVPPLLSLEAVTPDHMSSYSTLSSIISNKFPLASGS